MHLHFLFVLATSQCPSLLENLATAYNPGSCLLALPVICDSNSMITKKKMQSRFRNMYKKESSISLKPTLTYWINGGFNDMLLSFYLSL